LVTDRKPLKKASLSVTPPRAAGLFSSTVLKGGAPPRRPPCRHPRRPGLPNCLSAPAVASDRCERLSVSTTRRVTLEVDLTCALRTAVSVAWREACVGGFVAAI
jgi:hypothetical protein